MKKFYLLAFIAILTLWGAGKIQAQGTAVQRIGVTVPAPGNGQSMPAPADNKDIPDDIVYRQMFEQVIFMSRSDGKQGVNCQGQPLGPIFEEYAHLDGREYRDLLKIARDTDLELKDLAQKSMPILKEFRARVFGRAPGDPLPPPPPELEALHKQKIEILEGAMEKIKTSFGEKDFARFSKFVDKNFRSGIIHMTIDPPR